MPLGGTCALNDIPHFKSGLVQTVAVEPFTAGEHGIPNQAATLDWSSVEPAIFGTLFERSLDPATRAVLGTQDTGCEDIEPVVQPVMMQLLRRPWDDIRAIAEKQRGLRFGAYGADLPPAAAICSPVWSRLVFDAIPDRTSFSVPSPSALFRRVEPVIGTVVLQFWFGVSDIEQGARGLMIQLASDAQWESCAGFVLPRIVT